MVCHSHNAYASRSGFLFLFFFSLIGWQSDRQHRWRDGGAGASRGARTKLQSLASRVRFCMWWCVSSEVLCGGVSRVRFCMWW
jgi:hypothetical protein